MIPDIVSDISNRPQHEMANSSCLYIVSRVGWGVSTQAWALPTSAPEVICDTLRRGPGHLLKKLVVVRTN